MKRLLARLSVALLFVALLVTNLATPAHAEDTRTPMTRFASCLAGGGQGNVLMLLDTSGSLKKTDPQGGRLAAAKAVVQQFADAAAQRAGTKLNLAISGFSETYFKTMDWTEVTQNSVGQIQQHIDSYATKNTGEDTDYWTALDGARREFAALSGNTTTQCNLMMWFSDGSMYIEPRTSETLQEWGGPKAWVPDNTLRTKADTQAALAAAEKDLCREGGLADQLRSLGVVTIGLGLAVNTDADTFDLMRGVVTGKRDSGTCGNITNPTPGQFLMAKDVDSLIFDFLTVLDPTEPKAVTNKACVGEVCSEGTRTFVLDGSIGSVAATAKAPVSGTKIYLRPRVGDPIELTSPSGEKKLSGATLKWHWVSDLVLTMDLVRDGQSENWAGPWGLTFVAPSETSELAKSTVTLKGDIRATLVNKDVELRSGEKEAEIKLGVIDKDGNRIDPTTLSFETRLDVHLVTAEGSKLLAEGLFQDSIEAPLPFSLDDRQPGEAELVLTLKVTTQSWSDGSTTLPGTTLEPQQTSFPLTILAPANYPTFPKEINFGKTEKADPVKIKVPFEGDGCAWLAGKTSFTGYPDGQEKATLTSPATSRENCAKKELELTIDPNGLGNGSFVGTTVVNVVPADSTADPVAVEVAFTLSQNRPASQPVLWTVLIVVTLLGVAVPVGILYLTKFLTAKIPGSAVLGGSASGNVDSTSAFTDAEVPIDITKLQLAHISNRREVSVAGKTLRAKTGLAITEPGYVVVETAGRSAGGRGMLQSVADNAKLPLGVQGTWMVELDPQRPVSGPVTVTIFTAPGAAGINDLFDDIRANIRTAVERLREGLPPDSSPQTTSDPWDSSTPTAQTDPWATPSASTSWTPAPGRPVPPATPPAPAPSNDPWNLGGTDTTNGGGSTPSGPRGW